MRDEDGIALTMTFRDLFRLGSFRPLMPTVRIEHSVPPRQTTLAG